MNQAVAAAPTAEERILAMGAYLMDTLAMFKNVRIHYTNYQGQHYFVSIRAPANLTNQPGMHHPPGTLLLTCEKQTDQGWIERSFAVKDVNAIVADTKY